MSSRSMKDASVFFLMINLNECFKSRSVNNVFPFAGVKHFKMRFVLVNNPIKMLIMTVRTQVLAYCRYLYLERYILQAAGYC